MLLTVHPDSIRQADGFVLPGHRVGIDAVVVTLIHARKEQTRSVERDIETTKLWYESYTQYSYEIRCNQSVASLSGVITWGD